MLVLVGRQTHIKVLLILLLSLISLAVIEAKAEKIPPRSDVNRTHITQTTSLVQLASSAPNLIASSSENCDDGQCVSFPFVCPQCGYGATQGGFCPICHIPFVEATADSPDTEQPSEDTSEDPLQDSEAVDPSL